ncbi:hypothetical protein PVAP13_6KG273618 [Panicum virgatum]|uniref:Uncharacterized protein n=1 Tax=Panicum virgatum TaxID=38727 RepID=A0A8T0RE36_PANVG|nr:hypothetical protein PVAP13_6KG273618 [Panicum virgatum]
MPRRRPVALCSRWWPPSSAPRPPPQPSVAVLGRRPLPSSHLSTPPFAPPRRSCRWSPSSAPRPPPPPPVAALGHRPFPGSLPLDPRRSLRPAAGGGSDRLRPSAPSSAEFPGPFPLPLHPDHRRDPPGWGCDRWRIWPLAWRSRAGGGSARQ